MSSNSLSMYFPIFIALALLVSTSNAESNAVFDYCVGDLSLPSGPAGYSCKDPAKVTTDDFVYSALGVAGNTKNTFKLGITPAFSAQFPGLNGMGISMARLDIGVDGVVPIHVHRVSEIIILIEGTIIAGFIDTNNTAFYKTLNKGDIMIFPPSMLHFQVNVGSTPALAFVSLASANPGFEIIDTTLFQSSLPSNIIEKVTLLDHTQVRKLKKVFGGSN